MDDDCHFVMPDISVICDKDKIDEKGCLGAPDFVIEIVSPSSRNMDYVRKLKLYQESGVREYWIVDPQIKTVTVYHLEHGAKMRQNHIDETQESGKNRCSTRSRSGLSRCVR